MLPEERAPDSPFKPGELDAHQVTEIDVKLQALPDADAERVAKSLAAAIQEKIALGQFKEVLQMGVNVGTKLGIKGFTGI